MLKTVKMSLKGNGQNTYFEKEIGTLYLYMTIKVKERYWDISQVSVTERLVLWYLHF